MKRWEVRQRTAQLSRSVYGYRGPDFDETISFHRSRRRVFRRASSHACSGRGLIGIPYIMDHRTGEKLDWYNGRLA